MARTQRLCSTISHQFPGMLGMLNYISLNTQHIVNLCQSSHVASSLKHVIIGKGMEANIFLSYFSQNTRTTCHLPSVFPFLRHVALILGSPLSFLRCASLTFCSFSCLGDIITSEARFCLPTVIKSTASPNITFSCLLLTFMLPQVVLAVWCLAVHRS